MVYHCCVQSRSRDGSLELFVKWHGLEYDQCTWEPEASLEEDRHLVNSFILRRQKRRAAISSGPRHIDTYTASPGFLKAELYPFQLEGLNRLLLAWSKRTNTILADEMGLGTNRSTTLHSVPSCLRASNLCLTTQ